MNGKTLPDLKTFASDEEKEAYRSLAAFLEASPIPSTEILANLSLYLDRSALSHILVMQELYSRIIDVPGIIIEFGVRWGRNLATLVSLRNIYEPRNPARTIVGFDTFGGFPTVAPQDGTAEAVVVGGLSVTDGYDSYLEGLLAAHEKLGFRSHIRKFDLVKGDVVETLPKYLADHPNTIIAMAYFDLDLYQPTKLCLELIKDHLVKGSVVGFDELTLQDFPGEGLALREVWGLSKHKIRRTSSAQYEAFIEIE